MFGRSRIELKTPAQFRLMRAAGLVVAGALSRVSELAAPGVTTRELDAAAEDFIRSAGATSNFKGYHGFPAVICTSVNDQVVHGIPGDDELAAGDLLSVDCGAVVDGWHADAAITIPIGEVGQAAQELSGTTRAALWAAIARAVPGGRLSDIGAACEAEVAGRYGIVRDYVGHGIGSQMHMDPSVNHVGPGGRGPVLKPGMALAIEPMIAAGGAEVRLLEDGWTVVTTDGSLAAHWEHSVAITARGPFVLTAPDGGAGMLGPALGSID